MPTRPLVLASASPARLRLLREAGFDPQVIVSGVDEEAIAAGESDPRRVVQALAEAKANAVAARPDVPADALVIGCDSMLLLGEDLVGKPATPQEAIARWHAMRGGQGVLLTGHCVVDRANGTKQVDAAETLVRFGSPTDDEIAAYVATGEPLGVAGAFTLQGRSAPFIDGIDGDPGNVIGLSLPLLRRLLHDLDIEVTDLWA